MITDSHCHLASAKFSEVEVVSLIKAAEEAGVRRLVTLATCLEDVARNLEIARHPHVRCAVGIHPCDVHSAPDDAVESLAAFVGDGRVCAVGETGLDYFHAAPEGWSEGDFRSRQREFLRAHFELAAASGLNVVIHTRDREGTASFDDALGIYVDFAARVRAVFHCFVAELEMAERVIGLGGLVSFGGVVTFKGADVVKRTVVGCAAGSFMVETDAPYLAPVPVRGKRNEPSYARHTAEAVAVLRGESLEELARHTERAADEFFRWSGDSI